jgi:hypothetical protein
MDAPQFDRLATFVGSNSRRHVLRLLAGTFLTAPFALLAVPVADAKGRGKKKKKNGNKGTKKGDRPPPPPDRPCPRECSGCETCVDGACVDLPPLCDEEQCQRPVCNVITRQWACGDKPGAECDTAACEVRYCDSETGAWACADLVCQQGEVCCNGACEPACTNGCHPDPGAACLCESPPEGTTYCFTRNVCVDTQTNVDHCGGCGQPCAWCTDLCPELRADWACCEGTCRYTREDRNNCGGCGVQCAYEEECRRGQCVPACEFSTFTGMFCGRNPRHNDPLGLPVCTSPTHPTCHQTCNGEWQTCFPNAFPCLEECEQWGNCGCNVPSECRKSCD